VANEQYGVTLTADSQQYQQSLNQSVQSTNSLTDALGRAGVAMQGLWQKTNRKLTFIAAGEVAAITAASIAAGNLQQQMAQLQARQVLLHQDTNSYVGTVSNLQRQYGQTSQQAVQLIQQLNQLQVPFRQQQATAQNYIRMASVTGENVNQLATSQQNFMRAMGGSQRSVENYSSMMSKLQATTGASASATADFATSIAPISRTLGINSKEVAGISAAFVKSGQDGYAAANVYTKIMSDINRATQYGSPELKTYADLLGVSVDQFKQMPKAEAITQIFDDLNKQGPRGIKMLEQLGLEGVRSQRAIASVAQQGGLGGAINTANDAYSKTGDYQKASKEALSGMNDELSKTQQSLTAVAQGFGSLFIPMITKAVQAVNTFISPLVKLTTMLASMPDWMKSMGALLAGGAVAANFIPRIIAGLAGATGIAQVLRGPASLGVRAGFRPNNLNEAQQNFMKGEGMAGPRTLFRAGEFVGRNVRPSTWVERFGGAEGLSRYQDRMANLGGSAGDRWRRLGISAVSGVGSLASSMFLPWQKDYLQDPSQMHKNPFVSRMMMTDQGTWGDQFKKWFGVTQEQKDAFRDATGREAAAGNLAAIKAQTGALNSMNKETNNATTVMGQFRKSAGQFARAGLNAMGGAAYEGGRMGMAGLRAGAPRALGALGRGVGAVTDFLGGPVGLAMMAGTAAVGAYGQYKSGIEGGKVDAGDDVGAGHTYREALGIAARATTSFADVINESAHSINDAVTSVAGAIQVSAKDIQTASGKPVQDQNVKNLTGTNLQNYVTGALYGASPQEAQSLKYDLLAKGMSQSEVQQMLNTGTNQNTPLTGLYGAINTSNQTGLWGTGLFNQFGLSSANQQNVQTATGTAQQQLALINQRLGPQAANQFTQAQYADLVRANYGAATASGGFDTSQFNGTMGSGSREAQGRQQAFLQFLGTTDPESLKALQQTQTDLANQMGGSTAQGQGGGAGIRNRFGGRNAVGGQQAKQLTAEEQNKLIRNSMNKLANSGTPAGEKMRQAMIDAGMNPNLTYDQGTLQDDPLSVFGNEQTRSSMAISSSAAANLFGTQNQNQRRVISAMNNEGNAGAAFSGTQALMYGQMGSRMGGGLDQTIGELQKFGGAVGAANPPLRAMIDAAEQASIALRNYKDTIGGRTTLMDQAGTRLTDFGHALAAYRQNPNDETNVKRLQGAQDDAKQTALSINDWMQNMVQQYRAFDRQRQQGQEQLDRSMQRQNRDYGIQMEQADQDFNTQRSRNEENYHIQRNRNISDFHQQEQRAQADFNKQRSREEQDHQTQLKRMAEDSAKSFYDVYTRITTQRTWDSASLLQNMGVQTQAMQQQKTDLGTLRKMGLSNAAIQQLGLSDPQQAQEVTRLLQGLQANPSQIKQFNAGVGTRTQSAGSLAMDAGNTEYARSEADRKKALKRSSDDFDESMDRQRSDFHKQLSRSGQDFSRAMSQSQSDYNKMRKRQQDALKRSQDDMQSDFNNSMKIQLSNINFFAQQTSQTFTDAQKTVESRTSGMTKKQVQDMGDLMGKLNYVVVTQVDSMDTTVAGPYKKWGISPQGKQLISGGMGGAGGRTAPGKGNPHGNIPGGGPGDDASVASVLTTSHIGGGGSGGSGKKDWPVANHHVGTPWGKPGGWKGSKTLGPGFHSGADFPVGVGTPVHAVEDGTISSAGWKGAYGNMVDINHGGGIHTWYAHNSSLGVKRGDHVTAGEVISHSGETGRAFGPHVHLELRVNGYDKDPIPWLKGAATPSGGSPSGSGQSGATEPHPDFKKFVEKFESEADAMNYLSSHREQFHSGFYYKKGELADAMAADFHEQWQNKYGGVAYGDGSTGDGGVTTGGKGGAMGIWNALRTGGLSEVQAAGVMGNMHDESGLSWNIKQGGGTSNNPSSTGAGYGLVQWTPGSKLTEILKAMGLQNSLENQVKALLNQLSGHGPDSEGRAGKMLKEATSVFDATKAFLRGYERAADTSDAAVNRRNKWSEQYYKQFHGGKLPDSGAIKGTPGDKFAQALKWAESQSGLPYVFGSPGPGGYDCSGFIGAVQNYIEGKPLHVRRYSTQQFGGHTNFDHFTKGKKSPFMIGVKPDTGRSGHMAGTLDGVNIESSGGKGVHYGRGARGWNDSYFSWRGGYGGYGGGTGSANPGWHWVGEHGPELRAFKGGETVLNAAQSMNAMMRAKSNQVVSASGNHITTNNNSFDHSVQVASVTVKADNPRTMLTELEREARFAALTGTKK
jgi:TP901 family phage tail tape measure protein